MKKVILAVMFLISLSIITAETKEIITLDKALELARKNNIDIKRSSLELEGKRRSKNSAYNVFYPEVSGTTTFSRQNVDPNTTALNAGYSAAFNFTPALFTAVTLLQKDYELGVLTYDKAVKKVDLNVKEIFYNIIILKEQISLLEDNLKTIGERYNQMEQNYNAGLVSEYELLQIQVNYENFKPELNSVYNTYNSVLLNFKTLLGIPLNQEIDIEGEIAPEIVEFSVEESFKEAQLNNSDFKSLEKLKEFYKAQKRSQFSRDFLPIINLTYSQSTMLLEPFEDDNLDIDNFSDDSGSFSITMMYSFHNLLPNSSARVELEKVDRSIADTDLQLKALSDGLELQVNNYISVLNNSVTIQEGLELTVLLAEKSLTQVKQAYDAGTAQTIDVESAENEYKKARLELLKEKFNYIHNLINLEAIILP